MEAWHFIRSDWTTGNGGISVHEGHILSVDSPPVLCRHGLHASRLIMGALYYAPGPIICRVDCRGTVIHGDDKLVCSEREVLWAYDATDALWRFSRRCALDVIHLWDAPDVVVRYLKTGDESIRAAANAAAWAAARDATMATARATANDAAAAWAAAWATANDADAAWAAAWAAAAAWATARATANDAAWAAARDAAMVTHTRRLTAMIAAGRPSHTWARETIAERDS